MTSILNQSPSLLQVLLTCFKLNTHVDFLPLQLNGSSPCEDAGPSKTEPVASSASAVCSCQCPRWTRPHHWIYRGEGNASGSAPFTCSSLEINKLFEASFFVQSLQSLTRWAWVTRVTSNEVVDFAKTMDDSCRAFFIAFTFLHRVIPAI